MDYRIKETLVKIENNLSQPLTADTLAQSIGLSRFHLLHLFKKEIGISLAKYIKEFRLQEARKLLETTHLSIKEIRFKVGLDDKTHFFRDFKKRFGITPGEYRKNFHE